MPLYPQNQTVPAGQTAPFQPQWQSFLPTDPNAMATGLTPQMMQGINKPPSMVPPPGQQPGAAGPSSSYQQLMDFFNQMGGFGGALGGGMGPGMSGGMGGGMGGGFGPDPSRQQVQQAMQAMYFGRPLPGQANIPKPQPGANGLISPGDQAAYTSAKQQADRQRDQLAKQIIDARRMRRRPGGSR